MREAGNGNSVYEERDSVNDIILTEQGLVNINNQKGSDAGC